MSSNNNTCPKCGAEFMEKTREETGFKCGATVQHWDDDYHCESLECVTNQLAASKAEVGRMNGLAKELGHNYRMVITRAEADSEFDDEGTFRKLFKKLDSNRDGTLSQAETDAFNRPKGQQQGP